jgi:hypothetical protein
VNNGSFSLYEDESNQYLECEWFEDANDFVLEFNAINPSDVSNGFDYGVLFRDDSGDNLRLGFDEWGWRLNKKFIDGEFANITSGSYKQFDSLAGARNHIKLIAKDSKGYLFINDLFIEELNLSSRTYGDGIALCTDMYSGNGRTGNVIRMTGVNLFEILH